MGKRDKNRNKKFAFKNKQSIKKSDKTAGKQIDLHTFSGTIDSHPDGYAFFIFDNKEMEDIFIPSKKLNGAMHKDKVTIVIESFRGKKEGRVVDILERGIKQIIGRVEKSENFAYVVPFVKKFSGDIYIPKKFIKGLKTDDVVLCEITAYSAKGRSAEGVIIKRIGNLSDEGIENEIVLAKYELTRNFPKSVIYDVEKNSAGYYNNTEQRKSFLDLFTVTIDGESARDFDDAISIKKSNGGFILYVHIADVAHFVRPLSEVEKEAYKRGTSVYFPEFAIPMLPEILSNDLCSLKPNEVRLTLTAEIHYDNDGNRISSQIHQSKIKSDHRLTYNQVSDIIENKVKNVSKRILYLVNTSVELMTILMKRRELNGTIDFNLPEVDYAFNTNGEIEDIKPFERKISHRLIEHFMIEANEAVSEFLEKKLEKSVFRVHDRPDAVKIEEFVKKCINLGINIPAPEDISPKSIQKFSALIDQSKYSYILNSMLVRTMKKAIYDTKNIGHFGLASESYTHFTSPIRRYPDLIVHRLIKKLLFNYKYDIKNNYLDIATTHSSMMEQKAEDAEREINQFKILKFLEKHRETSFDGFVNRVTGNGLYIFIEKLLFSGFVAIENIIDDTYSYDSEASLIIGKKTKQVYKAGTQVKVILNRVNYDYLEADFVITN